MVLAACSGPVDWVVDATLLARDHPDAPLLVELYVDGVIDETLSISPVSVQPVTRLEDRLESGQTYGIRGWADLNDDGVCDPRTDGAWLFQTFPRYGQDAVWRVVVDDPQRTSSEGCLAADLDDLVEDTDPPAVP